MSSVFLCVAGRALAFVHILIFSLDDPVGVR